MKHLSAALAASAIILAGCSPSEAPATDAPATLPKALHAALSGSVGASLGVATLFQRPLSLALGVDIATYINDVFVYVDRIENHGVPLTTNAAESVYTALPDGTIVTAAPPQPPASLR